MLGPFSPSAAQTLRRTSPRKGAPAPDRGRHHALPLALVALAGAAVFLLGLGETGVVDETPALFAAAARHMAESGLADPTGQRAAALRQATARLLAAR